MRGTKILVLALFSAAFLSFMPVNKKLIVIDAGHGGDDFGTKRDGFYEKDIALNIGKEIQKLGNAQDLYEVILTRNDDSNIPLSERTAFINKLNPEMVISLHMNSSPHQESEKHGQEIYVQATEGSKKLAEKISQEFSPVPEIMEKNLHILRETKSPAVLVELGFLNNTEDRKYVTSEKGKKEIAQKFVNVFNKN